MSLQTDEKYGYVGHDQIEDAITERLRAIDNRKAEALAQLLSEAVSALLEVNSAIPVQSNQRHLVAQALEKFANGSAS